MNIRAKLLLGISISTVMVSAPFRRTFPELVAILNLLPLGWLFKCRRWKGMLIYTVLLAISYLPSVSFFNPVSATFPWLLSLFLVILQHLLPGLTFGYLILQTTSISEYLNGLSRLHIPMSMALATSVLFRFFPTIRAENEGIKQAVCMRGLSGWQALIHPIRFFNYRLVPLLLCTSRIGDELSMASLCRGLSTSRPRTIYPSDDLRVFDWLVIVFALVLWLLFVWVYLKGGLA